MGSFNLSCAVSGLSIAPGTAVYVLLVTSNHDYAATDDIYTNALWVTRAPAMLGTYEDYGRVKLSDADDERAIQRIAERMLDLESVERGSARGAPVKHGMGMAAYIEAAREGTLLVNCEDWRSVVENNARLEQELKTLGEQADGPKDDPPAPLIGPIPTVASVISALELAGLHGNNPHAPSYVVNEYDRGEIVVSCSTWGTLKIGDAKAAVEPHYACVLARGRGYSEDTVLRVLPKPNADGWVGPGHFMDRDEPKPVRVTLIRADVWRALLAMKRKSWSQKSGITISQYVEDEKAFREHWLALLAKQCPEDDPYLHRMLARCDADRFLSEKQLMVAGHLGIGTWGGGSGSPSITGWGAHYEAWILSGPNEHVDAIGARFAEGCMIYDHLQSRWLRLMPSQYAGQEERWDEQSEFHQMIADIATREEEAWRKEYGESYEDEQDDDDAQEV